MDIKYILKILTNKKLIIDFLGTNEVNGILEKILKNETLIDEIQNIPPTFWKDAIQSGIIVLSDYTYATKKGRDESIDFRYIDIERGKRHLPALVYQKKKQIEIKAGLHR